MSSSALADHPASIVADLANHGYAVVDDCDTGTAEHLARLLGSVRTGWQTLVSKPEDAADPWSLSGRYGLGQFPWHIDGAVASMPPRLFVLHCSSTSDVAEPTELLDFTHESNRNTAQLLSKVVLRARNRTGRIKYLPAILHSGGTPMLRWDPRTCEVARPEWERIGDIIEATPPTSEVAWRPNRVAFIDNRRNLHRRPPIKTAGVRELRRLYVY